MAVELHIWWTHGRHESVPVNGDEHTVFLHDDGNPADPPITLLHGWPTSSWDWAEITDDLQRDYRVIAPDLLGLGASAKGDQVPYDIRSQATMIESLWKVLGVQRTRLVAHDVGTIVAQELLARRAERGLDVELVDIIWLNGSLDPSAYQPTDTQLALVDPSSGPELVQFIDETAFTAGLAAVHAHPPSQEVLHQHWLAMSQDDGHLGTHRFLQYIPQRAADAGRLLGAVIDADIPMRFVWGLADPVSGSAQLDSITRHLGRIRVTTADDAGHYPNTERPDLVISAVRR